MKIFFLCIFSLLTLQIFAQNNCNTKSTIDVVTCEAYTSPSGDQTFNSTGKYTDIIPNTLGCDSLIEVNLTVNEPIEVNCAHLNEVENNCYRVVFTVQGGNPSGEGGTYFLSGDYEGLIAPKESITSHCIDINEVFKVNIDDGNGCSMSFTDGFPGFLPATLISFDIETETNGYLLKWTTASEIENDYFILERSTDGLYFNEIAQIKGSGTTPNPQSYTYFDEFDQNGLVYYKLNIAEFDGTISNLEVVAGERYELSFSIGTIFPNPVEEILKFDVLSVFDTQPTKTLYESKIKIYNAAQQIVLDLEPDLKYGINIIALNVRDFPNGVYTIAISSNGQVITDQFVKGLY